MTDRPYTDDDLRAEAARQFAEFVKDADFMGIGEAMEYRPIASRPRVDWNDLDESDFAAAHDAIGTLIRKAADISRWAVALGADRLVPSDEHVITLSPDDRLIARVHFAFERGVPEAMRSDLVQGLGEAINAHLRARGGGR